MSRGPQLRVMDGFALVLTDSAARRVREIVHTLGLPPETAGLRVAVVAGGCSDFTYDVKVVDAPALGDAVYECNGTRVFVDDASAPYVKGMTVDWIATFQESRFAFHNPNATGGCGCGISFTVD